MISSFHPDIICHHSAVVYLPAYCITTPPFWERGKDKGTPLAPRQGGPLHPLFLSAPVFCPALHAGCYTATSSRVSSSSGRDAGTAVGAVITCMCCCSIASRLSSEMPLSVISVSRS